MKSEFGESLGLDDDNFRYTQKHIPSKNIWEFDTNLTFSIYKHIVTQHLLHRLQTSAKHDRLSFGICTNYSKTYVFRSHV